MELVLCKQLAEPGAHTFDVVLSATRDDAVDEAARLDKRKSVRPSDLATAREVFLCLFGFPAPEEAEPEREVRPRFAELDGHPVRLADELLGLLRERVPLFPVSLLVAEMEEVEALLR